MNYSLRPACRKAPCLRICSQDRQVAGLSFSLQVSPPLHASICLPDYPPRCSPDTPGGSPKPNMFRFLGNMGFFPPCSFLGGFSHDQGAPVRSGYTCSVFSSAPSFQLGTNRFNQVMGIPPPSAPTKAQMNSVSSTFLFPSVFCSSSTPG